MKYCRHCYLPIFIESSSEFCTRPICIGARMIKNGEAIEFGEGPIIVQYETHDAQLKRRRFVDWNTGVEYLEMIDPVSISACIFDTREGESYDLREII